MTSPRPALGVTALLFMLILAMGSASACNFNTDFADDLVEKTAERNQRRLLEQQRQELPLPDPEEVRYIPVSADDLVLDDDFTVDLVDDLVLGEGRTDPDYLFVRFRGGSAALGNVAVDDEGRIFVLETRSDEVRAFDRSGEFLFKFGQPGEGPADFNGPYGLLVAGDSVHVFHRRYSSSIWDLEGRFVRDRRTLRTPEAEEAARLEETSRGTRAASPSEAEGRRRARRARVPLRVYGRPDGSIVMVTPAEPGETGGRISTPYVLVVGRFEDGAEVQRYLEVPEWATPTIAMAPDGGMYVAMFGHLRTEYYIVALDGDGDARWVLTVPWDSETPPRADLRVDGQGRLFVFPNFLVSAEDTRSPVHVYTRDGEIIGSGYLNRLPVYLHWQVSGPDRVHGVRTDPVSEEWEVVRYRLVLAGQK